MITASDALQELQAATDRMLATCARVSDEEWRHRTVPQSWSVGDIVEHVTIAHRGAHARLAALASGRELTGAPDVADAEIPYLFYRGDEPPNIAVPSGAFHARREHIAELGAAVRAIVGWAPDNLSVLRRRGAAHPLFGVLDGVQWLLFAAAHSERHRAQIVGDLTRLRTADRSRNPSG